MAKERETVKISLNAPVVLTFAFICLIALILGGLTGGKTTNLLFSECHSSLLDPFTYVRFVGHVFGHANWSHFIGNMMLFLVVGPLLEEKYGSGNLITVILVTAIVTGAVNYVLFPNTRLLGASGVVFAFILLSSVTSMKDGSIPLTFILVAVMYIGQQIYEGFFVQDNVSNLAHIVGGIVGAAFGFTMNRGRR